MMGKKKPNDDVVSDPSSIFTTLFGGVSDENTVAFSIFSDTNPFKRKHQESQSAENESISNPMNLDSLGTDISELKIRKKDDVEEEASKVSKLISQNSISGFEPNGSSENEIKIEPSSYYDSKSDFYEQKQNPNLDIEGKKGSEKKKTEKRKRDDVEKEYEEKKYGAIAEGVGKKIVVGEKRKKEDNEMEDMFFHTKEEEEGFDDEGKLLRTVFVGNLPLKARKKALIREFSKFGEIDSVRIRSVPVLDIKIPRKGAILQKQINDNADSVHAYIVFKSEQSTEAALVHNMAVVGGNHIRVDRACPPRKKLKGEDAPLYDNKRTVFVGNLPFDVKDEDIYQLFCGLKDLESSVEAVRVIRHPHMRVGKGIAYVLFKTTKFLKHGALSLNLKVLWPNEIQNALNSLLEANRQSWEEPIWDNRIKNLKEAANKVVKIRNLKLGDSELRLSYAQQNSTPSKRKDVAGAVNPPAKKFALDSRTSDSGNRSNSKAAMSYQGLQASKSGSQKKAHLGSSGLVKMKKSRTQQGDKPKVRLEKRPAVALKKEREKAPEGISASKQQAGSKRKLDSRTPDISQRKKAKTH